MAEQSVCKGFGYHVHVDGIALISSWWFIFQPGIGQCEFTRCFACFSGQGFELVGLCPNLLVIVVFVHYHIANLSRARWAR